MNHSIRNPKRNSLHTGFNPSTLLDPFTLEWAHAVFNQWVASHEALLASIRSENADVPNEQFTSIELLLDRNAKGEVKRIQIFVYASGAEKASALAADDATEEKFVLKALHDALLETPEGGLVVVSTDSDTFSDLGFNDSHRKSADSGEVEDNAVEGDEVLEGVRELLRNRRVHFVRIPDEALRARLIIGAFAANTDLFRTELN